MADVVERSWARRIDHDLRTRAMSALVCKAAPVSTFYRGATPVRGFSDVVHVDQSLAWPVRILGWVVLAAAVAVPWVLLLVGWESGTPH